MERIHRRWILVVAAVALAVAIPLASSAGASGAGNLGRAQRETVRLLRLLHVPPNAVALSTAPKGGLLSAPGYEEATPNLVDAHRWWTVRGRIAQVLAYVRAHLPGDATPFVSGGGGPRPEWRFESFALPPIAGVLRERVLAVSVAQLTATTAVVRTDGEAVWIVPRPVTEAIPAGIHQIDIRSAYPGRPPSIDMSVTDPAKVRQIVRWIDAFGIVQPGSWNCPVLGGPIVSFDFRAGGGARLAHASVMDFQGTSGECNPIALTIRGRQQPALIGGDFGRRVEGLLGVRLAGAAGRFATRTVVFNALRANGIAGVRFGASPRRVRNAIDSLLGQRGGAYQRGGSCNLDHEITWTDRWTASGQPALTVYFGRSRFLGYEFGTLERPRHPPGGWALATARGLTVGDPLARGRRLYGGAFSLSAAQGGTWSLRTRSGMIDGYALQSLVATIDAGDVGCPAIAP